MVFKLLYSTYLLVLALNVIISLARYKRFDAGAKIILLLLSVTALSELVCYIRIENGFQKAPVFHFYSVFEIVLTSLYFLKTVKPYHHTLFLTLTLILWPLIAFLNAAFLQPLNKFNSNYLLLESIAIIAMSLYALYTILLDDLYLNVLRYPHFWIWSLQLILWSSSFFFWGYYEVLVQRGVSFIDTIAHVQAVINILVYLGIGLTLFFYPKPQLAE